MTYIIITDTKTYTLNLEKREGNKRMRPTFNEFKKQLILKQKFENFTDARLESNKRTLNLFNELYQVHAMQVGEMNKKKTAFLKKKNYVDDWAIDSVHNTILKWQNQVYLLKDTLQIWYDLFSKRPINPYDTLVTHRLIRELKIPYVINSMGEDLMELSESNVLQTNSTNEFLVQETILHPMKFGHPFNNMNNEEYIAYMNQLFLFLAMYEQNFLDEFILSHDH